MSELKYCCGHKADMPLERFSPGQLHRRGSLCLDCLRKRNHRPKDRWFSVRTFAGYRHIPFELTLEQFTEIISHPCVYGNSTNVGLDRRDSALGYSVENSLPCCYKHNLVKGKWFSYEDMKVLVILFPAIRDCGDRPCKL
jgi:hypothetical protein